MAGILKVDKYQDFNGNDIMTSDGSGNITINNTALKMTPAFEAYIDGGNQTITNNVITKVQFNTETLDTDNCYDNVTNYRFTPNVSGKYYFYTGVNGYTGATNNMISQVVRIYKNGALYRLLSFSYDTNKGESMSPVVDGIIDMNGTTDYLEVFCDINGATGSPSFIGSSKRTYFGAYRIIGA